MTTGLFCLLRASSRSVVDKWRINLLLPLHARNSTKDRFQQSQEIYERFKGRAMHHTGSQTPAELVDWGLPANLHCILKDPSIPGRLSALESGDKEKGQWGGWQPTKDPGLSSNPQPLPLSRALIECKAPWAWIRPKSCCFFATAASIFYNDFLPFNFGAKKKLRGPICSSLPVSLFPAAYHTHAHVHTHSTEDHQNALDGNGGHAQK